MPCRRAFYTRARRVATLADASDWEGYATTSTDALPALEYRRSVHLRPIDCAAAPREPATLDTPLLRRIELVGGGALELGERLAPSIPVTTRRSGAWTALVQATGPWAGHDTIVVRLDAQQTVHHIELRYPPGFDMSPVLDSLIAAAPPSTQRPNTTRWRNRSTTLFVELGTRPRVVILDPRYF